MKISSLFTAHFLFNFQNTKDNSLGVIFIGGRTKAENIIWEFDSLSSGNKYGVHFIFTDAINQDVTIFRDGFGKGSITIAPSNLQLEDFYMDITKKLK